MCKFTIFVLVCAAEDLQISFCISGLVKVAILTCAHSVSSLADSSQPDT